MQVMFPKGVRQVRLSAHEHRTLCNAAQICHGISTVTVADDQEQASNVAQLLREIAAEYAPKQVHEAAEAEDSAVDVESEPHVKGKKGRGQ